MRIARVLATGILVLGSASRVLAQGCSMCYDSAAAQGPEQAAALNAGILVLLLPTLLLFGGVLATAVRRRSNKDDHTSN